MQTKIAKTFGGKILGRSSKIAEIILGEKPVALIQDCQSDFFPEILGLWELRFISLGYWLYAGGTGHRSWGNRFRICGGTGRPTTGEPGARDTGSDLSSEL